MTAPISQPIVQKFARHSQLPFVALSGGARKLLETAAQQIPQHEQKEVPKLLRWLECYLQITDQRLSIRHVNAPLFHNICVRFYGALYSRRFLEIRSEARYVVAKAFSSLLEAVRSLAPLTQVPTPQLSTTGPSQEILQWIDSFHQLPLNEEKVWLWTGWRTENRKGKVIWLSLYPVYDRLGRLFTQQLYETCDHYFKSRKAHYISCIQELAEFIGKYPAPLSAANFKDSSFVGKFWREFVVYYFERGYEQGTSISTLKNRWRHQFLNFVEQHLVTSGQFVMPWGGLPNIPPAYVSGAKTNVRKDKDGYQVKTKLLTHVALHVTDDEAMHLLFEQIHADVATMVQWAKTRMGDIWQRHERRLALAPLGIAREIQPVGSWKKGPKWLTSRDNPEHIQNAAATFQKYGYQPDRDTHLSLLYPHPLSLTAFELGLPTSNALIPHCVLLIEKYPRITDAFLCDLELFDKNGKRVGLVETDTGHELVGYKSRRGPTLAQQKISLDRDSAEVVLQMIALTDSLRCYLKARGDDQWRYLLLTCQKGFSYPMRVRRLSSITCGPARNNALASSISEACNIPFDRALSLAERFSPTTLRASAGVLVYLETRSVKAMSDALGHAQYDPKLLSSYLPEPIQAFFQERWVRIFQEGIIVEALKDSNYLQEASSFDNIDDLNKFLANHALKSIPKHLEDPEAVRRASSPKPTVPGREVHFGINTTILTLLLSLQKAVEQASRPVCAKARYWSAIAEHLVTHIETNLGYRADLQTFLRAARAQIDPTSIGGIIYVQS